MTRDERQLEAIKCWFKNKCKGSLVWCTGAGKTRTALKASSHFTKHYPNTRILVVVPTTTLKEQWESQLDDWNLSFNTTVEVINTVIKHNWTTDILILDEIHRYAADTFAQVFDKVMYKHILGLTATFDRLDGKHELLAKYCPAIDNLPMEVALINGWVSPYKEYEVLIDVDDIEELKKLNKDFVRYFEFFNFDFNLAMSCLGPNGWKKKIELRDKMYRGTNPDIKKDILQQITINSAGFIRTIQKRKAFINNHPKKIEIARKIIESRPDSKIVTFSNNIKMAEAIDNGNNVYSGRTSKKKGRIMIEDFNKQETGVLHTIRKLDEGADIKGLSVGIVLGTDSSKTKAVQRLGRICRFEEGKIAEMFYIIINDSVECEWFRKNHQGSNYTIIDEQGLEQVLNGEQPDTCNKKISEFKFRF